MNIMDILQLKLPNAENDEKMNESSFPLKSST